MKQALLLIAVFGMFALGAVLFLDGLLAHIDEVEARTAQHLEAR